MSNKDGFFSPKGIETYETYLRTFIGSSSSLTHSHGFRKNIGYSLQYLEYLDHLLKKDRTENCLHATIARHSQKTFIVVGIGIVEAIIWYAIKISGNEPTEEWETIKGASFSNRFDHVDHVGAPLQIRTFIERKLSEARPKEMKLKQMCHMAEKKRILGVKTDVYEALNHLRKLRNKVHIQAMCNDQDTDWWKIGGEDVITMKKALHSILTCSRFDGSTQLMDFLKPEESGSDDVKTTIL